MPKAASNHSRHTSNTFKKNEPSEPFVLGHDEFCDILLAFGGMSVSRHGVHSPPQQTNCGQSNPIWPISCHPMCYFDVSHLMVCVSISQISLLCEKILAFIHVYFSVLTQDVPMQSPSP